MNKEKLKTAEPEVKIHEVIEALELTNKKAEKFLTELGINTIKELIVYDVKKIQKLNKDFFNELVQAMMHEGYYFQSDQASQDLIDRIVKQSKMVEQMLIFIKDFGAYKRRKLYLLSDVEHEAKVKEFFESIITMVVNQCVAESLALRLGGKNIYSDMLGFVTEALSRKIKEVKKK